MMLNLVPDFPKNQRRIIESLLPKSINKLSRYNLRIRSNLLDWEFERSGSSIACLVTKKCGNLQVIIEV
ncbi:hypothetical protein IQ269_08730 [Tychonema sp. LEGE 07199]|uniref:hypothetical protein n=1 Tax=unclassified Tychonema TaxID=2642144 RepID=UPI001882FE7C|nr:MULTISPECIES: hypothetical protein [unclassified Tychonema]MBE9120900.1 hypothetical protein [Tychonema sp. LEGE 07199]MBE9133399.1 hypothetical protein [Tychonema sp. LEGE 07196]